MKRPRGAIPSPLHQAFAAIPHVPLEAIPASFGIIPSQLSYWGNDQYGDCVAAEEAFAKASYSVQNSQPELYIPSATLVQWATANRFLNGAVITDVLQAMVDYGITINGTTYRDGPYQSVDWTNDYTLSSAIYSGPVKIGVAADQLENVVRTANGWWGVGFSTDKAEDHCVSLCGYGSASQLATMLSGAVPHGVDPTERCYLMFTWSTIGIIDRPSLLAITGEAWLRTPTTPGTPSPTPQPTPSPTPTPTPVPPAPVPPPTPVPPDVMVNCDITKRSVIIPGGWKSMRGAMPSVIVHPNLQVIEVPKGWTVQH